MRLEQLPNLTSLQKFYVPSSKPKGKVSDEWKELVALQSIASGILNDLQTYTRALKILSSGEIKILQEFRSKSPKGIFREQDKGEGSCDTVYKILEDLDKGLKQPEEYICPQSDYYQNVVLPAKTKELAGQESGLINKFIGEKQQTGKIEELGKKILELFLQILSINKNPQLNSDIDSLFGLLSSGEKQKILAAIEEKYCSGPQSDRDNASILDLIIKISKTLSPGDQNHIINLLDKMTKTGNFSQTFKITMFGFVEDCKGDQAAKNLIRNLNERGFFKAKGRYVDPNRIYRFLDS